MLGYEITCSVCEKIFYYDGYGDHAKQRIRSRLMHWGWQLKPVVVCLFCNHDERIAKKEKAARDKERDSKPTL